MARVLCDRTGGEVLISLHYECMDDFFTDCTANFNIGGFIITTRDPLPVGAGFRLCFILPDRVEPIETTAVVRSVRDERVRHSMTVHFEGLSEADRQVVENWLDDWLQ